MKEPFEYLSGGFFDEMIKMFHVVDASRKNKKRFKTK